MLNKVRAFIKEYYGISSTLTTGVEIFKAFGPGHNTIPIGTGKSYSAIWDTGATNSVITQKVVNELGLSPVGIIETITANGTRICNRYAIAVGLPNKIAIPVLLVSDGDLGPNSKEDVLIGMDVIRQGDFAVSNHNRKTSFTFRMPSIQNISFVSGKGEHPQPRQIVKRVVGRNEQCPCGSGRKFKKCCGKGDD